MLERTIIERIPKSALVAAACLALVCLVGVAATRPGLFTDAKTMGGILFLEFLLATLWLYRRVFFAVILMAFLFAGSNLPVGPGWTVGRWIFLGVGALAGCAIILKERLFHFGIFHAVACFATLTALVSSAVSRYPTFAMLKASSLFLLFLYAATGARLSVEGRENRFFTGLIFGCEFYVIAVAACYAAGRQVMGNPNSLGAVVGIICAPVLLWGLLLDETVFVRQRRLAVFVLCLGLLLYSHSRAGILASAISCAVLCFSLRRYRMLVQGVGVIVMVIAAAAILRPAWFSETSEAVASSVVYKGQDPTRGLLASRESPWQSAMDTIRAHPWFGTGFGTTDNGLDASSRLSNFATETGVAAENGSSYLAITTWVGLAGVLPFLVMLLMVCAKIGRTLNWMWATANPKHPAVPLAVIAVAALLHAGFEDWLFAPGYYLCVFFWSMTFVLMDLAPPAQSSSRVLAWRPGTVARNIEGVASGQ